jgi:hypothetical protein
MNSVALLVIVMRYVDLYWLIGPEVSHDESMQRGVSFQLDGYHRATGNWRYMGLVFYHPIEETAALTHQRATLGRRYR